MGIDRNYMEIDGNYREINLIRDSHPSLRERERERDALMHSERDALMY